MFFALLQLLFGWLRCPWCGAWLPLCGRPSYGPRKTWHQCRSCGRGAF